MLGKEVTQSLTWKKQKATCREMSNDIVGSCKALWDNWIHTRLQVPIILILGILIWESSYHIFTKFHVKWTMTFFFGAEAFDLVLRKGQPGEARSAFPHFFWGGVIFSSKSSFFRGLQHWSWSWKHQVRARGEAENLNEHFWKRFYFRKSTEFEKPPIRVIFWFNRISTGHNI